MPAPTVLPLYCPTQYHLVILLPSSGSMAAYSHPGIAPALYLSQILRGRVEGLGAFPDRQVSWQIKECSHWTTPTSPFPGNATYDVYPPEILVSCSRGIAHMLPLPTCVAFCFSAKFTNLLGYPNTKLLGRVDHHFIQILPIHQVEGHSFHFILIRQELSHCYPTPIFTNWLSYVSCNLPPCYLTENSLVW